MISIALHALHPNTITPELYKIFCSSYYHTTLCLYSPEKYDTLDHLTTESDRRVKILDFVKDRQKAKQNTTKAIVITHMKDKRLASRETTHYLIKDLINEGKLTKKEINSQVHFLTINEDNDFNKIYNSISEFENFIVDKPFSDIKGLKINPKNPAAFNELGQLQVNLKAIVFFILQHFIDITKKRIQSEQDKQILYTKIMELLQEYTSYEMMPQDRELIDWFISRFDKWKKLPLQAKKMNVNVNDFKDKLDKYQTVLKNFKEEFLS
jgi:hypothetical protein